MKTRLIKIIGHRGWNRTQDESCKHFKDFDIEEKSENVFGHQFNCENCGQEFIPNGFSPRYDTPSGNLEPGCLFWMDWFPQSHIWNDGNESPCLGVVLPNGDHWNIDSRASNCTMPNDNTHRCWIRHGDPDKGEPIHVDKNGNTCQAGAGSIAMGNYHGFLHNGELT